jgi:hypothetical protein
MTLHPVDVTRHTRLARRARLGCLAAAAILLAAGAGSEAHKPITSPFTFNGDVLPIVEAKCAACHVRGGVAPMSLLTHADAVPWGESMRAELMAGHMPPWPVDSAASRFRNVQPLTARELNVLLTWASGGTPAGDAAGAATAAPASTDERRWPLGAPDLVLPMPAEIAIAGDVQEHVAEVTIPTGLLATRWLRAVDLLPGTPAIVRSATISIANGDVVSGSTGGGSAAPAQLLALWVPGDHPVPLDAGSGFALPGGASLRLRVRYRKTWENERDALTDRSSIGLYFADGPQAAVRALTLTVGTTTIAEPLRALAIHPDELLAHARVTVTATRPDGSKEELIAFRPRPGWARRYWFAQPIALPRGTRIDVGARVDEEELLPPGAPPGPAPANPSAVRMTLDVVPIT